MREGTVFSQLWVTSVLERPIQGKEVCVYVHVWCVCVCVLCVCVMCVLLCVCVVHVCILNRQVRRYTYMQLHNGTLATLVVLPPLSKIVYIHM